MKSKYFFCKHFYIAVVFSILLIAVLIPLEYKDISTLSFFDVQSSVNPTFQVHPQDNSVHGDDWGEDVLITLTVDNPSNGTGVDYSDSQTAYGEVEFNIYFDIQPGFLITMSDGNITKAHTVTELELISMDPESDQVSGLATEGSEVRVRFWWRCNAQRYVTTDSSGNWTADFTEPGEDPRDTDICDINEWEGNPKGSVEQEDNDGDSTETWFPDYRFRVYPDEDRVSTRSWTEGETVTLTIDDPSNGEGIDYTYYGTAPDKFDLSGVLDIVPGFRLTMTDGNFIKAHVVTDLQVLYMDPESDQVSGSAAEGSEVVVQFWGDGGCDNAQRYVTTDSSGTWTADFTEPGEDPRDTDICDINEWEDNQDGAVLQPDNDYDNTGARFLKGNITVRPEDDYVEGWGWPENVEITMTIDNPDNGPEVDYEDTQVSINTEDGTSVEFTTAGQIDIQPGFRVTMTDGNFIKAHVVTDLQVLSMDPVTDQVSGTATPNSRIRIRFGVGCNAVRDVTTDEDGEWTADFSGICNIDAFKKMRGHAKQEDNDWDSTRINFPNWRIIFGVFPEDDYTFSANWPEGAAVTISIDDPGTTEERDYFDTQTSTAVEGGTLVEFNYADEIDVQPGFLVTVTDGNFTKGHVVTSLEVLDVDTDKDMISGIAKPLSQINIRLSGVCEAFRTQSSDADGVWIADFSQPGDDPDEGQICDIDESVSGKAANIDDDWDSTNYWIHVIQDFDGDGIADEDDNAPNDFNPDQSDIDGDNIGDVADPCPMDPVGSCDPEGSAAVYVTVEDGGTLETNDGSVQIDIPPGALDQGTSVSITDTDSGSIGFELTNNLGVALGIFSVDLQPSPQDFQIPITIIFAWLDTNDDGWVDGTIPPALEENLIITQDNNVITDRCRFESTCDTSSNTFTFQVSTLSEFALGWPKDTDGDDVPDYFDGVEDNCMFVHNTEQADSNNDGEGDACDPVVTSITAPVDPVNFNAQPVSVSGTFSDPDDDDTHTAEWDWGDNTTSTGTVDQLANAVSDNHTYSEPGVYRITLTVADSYPASDDEVFEFIVVYDPDSGFVTGGGWILSLINDDYFYMDVEGRANFGFVSKYEKGASVPTGNTEFNFSAGSLNFHSETYQWLVVTGSDYAKFKGTGTINGEGEYKFMLWAGDDYPDTFRIKIWYEVGDTEVILYDNGMDQKIGGGNIVIHTSQ
ncbi:PKD domain-containing protein [Chloroflexota bacterium]